eukprot:59388-Rhodomonas_salina.2
MVSVGVERLTLHTPHTTHSHSHALSSPAECSLGPGRSDPSSPRRLIPNRRGSPRDGDASASSSPAQTLALMWR